MPGRMRIELKEVVFEYPTFEAERRPPALAGVSLQIEEGEAVGVVGPSGAGKSTLLQVLAGLEQPTEGCVFFDGKEIHREPSAMQHLRKALAFAFQFPEMQLFAETVFEDVAFGPRNHGLPEEEVRSRVEQALNSVGLAPEQYADRGIAQLSQGEKRRVALAGILALQPRFLLLDEPTAGLDGEAQAQLANRLKKYRARENAALMIASHDLDFLIQVVDRLLVMQEGRVVRDLPVEELEQTGDGLESVVRLPRILRLQRALHKMGIAFPRRLYDRQRFLQFLQKLPPQSPSSKM